MEDPYACTICWHQLTEPIVLNCGHTFDKACLKSIKTCPICRSEILGRSTNWQVLQILESRNRSAEYSSAEVELEDMYLRVGQWTTDPVGSRLKYTIKAKSGRIHYGWFRRFWMEQQVIEVYFRQGKTVRLPVELIDKAWHHPDLAIDKSDHDPTCCEII